jgi:trehalose 6-phosphate phosphatase
MQAILDPANQEILKKFIRRDTLMAFDYDGTLAPIVDNPEQAQMRRGTRELLRQVARHYPTVIITGRARAQIRKFLHDVELLDIIGNHGAESSETVPDHIVGRVADWRRKLENNLRSIEGVVIEDKQYSLSVHYRHARDPNAAFSVLTAAENLPGARRIGGKLVLNIVPIEAADKGTVLLRLCQRFHTSHSVFVGDDDTDEDVFALDGFNSSTILGIRVGSSERTAARFYIPSQADIDQFLETVITLSSGNT